MSWETVFIALGVMVALIGGVIMRDRQVHRTISTGDEKLHVRINRIQDAYVRREEFNQRMHALEGVLNQINQGQTALSTRIDALLSNLIQNRNP